jgi:RHS repeat-associated protein
MKIDKMSRGTTMTRTNTYPAILIAVLVCLAISDGAAQRMVATGTPPFGSFGGGQFDTINLGDLNVHFSVPVLNKAGRGPAFTYNLAYDSSVWTPAIVSGGRGWQPVANWGWQGATNIVLGFISYNKATTTCSGGGNDVTWSSFAYIDGVGVAHAFPGSAVELTGTCGTQSPTLTSTATDGSGYTLNFTLNSATVTSKSGKVINPPSSGSSSGAGSVTDANGNQITVNSSGQYFDTLSSTTPVLTVAGSGTPSSPTTFTYTAPSGGSASYTVNYTQYTVATDFGVSNSGWGLVKEYGPLSNALVSSITLPDGTAYAFSYEKTPGSCTPLQGTYSPNCVTARIASVTLPTGGEITYAYTGGTNSTGIYIDGSTAGLNRTLSPGGEWQYSRSLVTGSPGSGSTWTTTVIDPNSNDTVINFAEDETSGTPTYNFYETQRQIYQGSVSPSNLLATSIRCYNANYANCSTDQVPTPITQTDAYRQLPNGSTRLSEVLYNSYGLVTDDKEYNYGVALGAAPSSTYLVRETAITYASLGNGIVNKPSAVTVYGWPGGTKTTLASSSYAYDAGTPTTTSGTPQHIAITGSRGNLTSSITQTGGAAALSRLYTYYDTGNPNVATDVINAQTNAQTTYVYGSGSCGNSFATTINEPLSLSRSITWNCTGGIATQVTDENGNNVKTNYTDSDFWRPANVYDQENNETTISYIGETAVETALQNFNSGNSTSDFRSTVDGFGRPILSQHLQGPGATNYDTVERDYNSLGQPYRSTMPFSAPAGTTNSTAPGVNTTYDALGRVLTNTDADGGQVSYAYTNNDVLQTTSGSQTFQKQLEYDGLGRLTSVCEISSTLPLVGTCGQSNTKTGLWTKYTYDALGHLLTATQNAQAAAISQQTRSFAYDLVGRMTSESNPETGNSGTNGTTTYTWDVITGFQHSSCGTYSWYGNLLQKTDNAGNVTCYSYDVLHRLLQEGNSSVTNTTLREFFYDSEASYPTGVTVSNGKTHVVEAKTVNTSNTAVFVTDELFSYSPRGELTDVYEATPHSGSGVYYHTTAAYWPTGALQSLSGISSVPTIYYGANGAGLDGEGRYKQVTAASGTNPVSSVTYSTSSTTNPLGALTGLTFGSSDSDSFTYDPNTGRMSTYTFSVNGQTDAGTLTWNTNGTLGKLAIVDNIPGTSDTQTCSYTYDDAQRLSTSNCGSIWAQTFGYDSFGNITKSGSLTFAPLYSSTTNQFTLSGANVQYDADGNLLTDNLNTYTWDPNWGTMLTVTPYGGATVTATYDALGRMVENNAGGAYSEFVYGPTGVKLAKVNGTTLIKAFVALPGGAKAIYNSTGLAYYRHSDWLNSSRLTSTQARGLYSSSAYAPFGEQYATAGTADASFTGQDQDTVSTLYDFPARRQSPSQGRWVSPDPAGRGAVNLANPQSWNRYAYVLNNPLALTDPAGLSVRHHRHHRVHSMDEENDCEDGCPGDDDDDDDDAGSPPDDPGSPPDDPGSPPDNPGSPPDNPGSPPDNPGPACTVTVAVNNAANLTPEQVTAVEQQISTLFSAPGIAPGGVGVNFVDVGSVVANTAAYQINLNAGSACCLWEGSEGVAWSPSNLGVYVGTIQADMSTIMSGYPASLEQITGTIGAHELGHGLGLPDNNPPLSSTDIMGVDSMSPSDVGSALGTNQLDFSFSEADSLFQGCMSQSQ